MSITPASPPVNVSASPARPLDPPPDSLRARVLRALSATAFNRDLAELYELAEAFDEKLRAFWIAHDPGTVNNELIHRHEVISPEQIDDPEVVHALRHVEGALEDILGIAWAVRQFAAAVDGYVIPEQPEPCGVVGGKDGAR